VNYYKLIFGLVTHHKYSVIDLENMYPFERDLYVDMLLEFLEDKKKALENK